MTGAERISLRQGSQYLGEGYSIGVISVEPGPEGPLARLGVASPEGRSSHRVAEGDLVPLPDGRTARVAAIAVARDGGRTAVLLELTGPTP